MDLPGWKEAMLKQTFSDRYLEALPLVTAALRRIESQNSSAELRQAAVENIEAVLQSKREENRLREAAKMTSSSSTAQVVSSMPQFPTRNGSSIFW